VGIKSSTRFTMYLYIEASDPDHAAIPVSG